MSHESQGLYRITWPWAIQSTTSQQRAEENVYLGAGTGKASLSPGRCPGATRTDPGSGSPATSTCHRHLHHRDRKTWCTVVESFDSGGQREIKEPWLYFCGPNCPQINTLQTEKMPKLGDSQSTCALILRLNFFLRFLEMGVFHIWMKRRLVSVGVCWHICLKHPERPLCSRRLWQHRAHGLLRLTREQGLVVWPRVWFVSVTVVPPRPPLRRVGSVVVIKIRGKMLIGFFQGLSTWAVNSPSRFSETKSVSSPPLVYAEDNKEAF